MAAPKASRYDRYGRIERTLLIVCVAGLVVISGGLVFVPVQRDALVVHGLGVILVLVTVFFLVRALRFATIDISDQAVVVRGLLSTKRFPLADVDRFSVVGGFDQSGDQKSALAVRERSGDVQVFPDFSGVEEPGRAPLRELAGRLNKQLATIRVSTGFGAA